MNMGLPQRVVSPPIILEISTGNGTANQGSVPIPDNERFWYLTSGFENSGTVSANSSQSEYTTVSFLARALI